MDKSTISLDSCSRLNISGVTDVESFDDGLIVLNTTNGVLLVRGLELRVDKLTVCNENSASGGCGELVVHGRVDALEYEEERAKPVGLFGRKRK